jgi:serine/threonine protein kinase
MKDHGEFSTTSVLFDGYYSCVLNGFMNISLTPIVVKAKSKKHELYENEVIFTKILDKLDPHYNIHLPLISSKESADTVWLCYEKVHGDLFDFNIKKREEKSEKSLSYQLYKIIEMVATLHSLGYIHGDLKAENILVCDDLGQKLVLTDFEYSIKANQNEEFHVNNNKNHIYDNELIGTLEYLHPSMLDADPYSLFAHDIWSIIVLSINMFADVSYKSYSWVQLDNWNEKLLKDFPLMESNPYKMLFIQYINMLRIKFKEPYCFIKLNLLDNEFLNIWKK